MNGMSALFPRKMRVLCTLMLGIVACSAPFASAQVEILPLWTAGGLSAGTDSAGQSARVASDASGNIAAVTGPSNGRDLAVTSYSATGAFRWRSSVSPSVGTFVGDWVAAAPNGDFLAVGRNTSSSGQPIAITMVRYSSGGTLKWRVDLARTIPWVARLNVDSAGNAYLLFNSVGDGQDIQLHKYDSSGVLVWARVISTGFFANDYATSLSFGPDQADVVLTGNVVGGATWITASFDASTGTPRWQVTSPEGIAARDVVVDASRVYVTGQGNAGVTGYLTVVAYSRTSGAKLWRRDLKPADSGGAAGLRMALAPDGSLAVTGQAARGFLDWYTVALETNGAVRWEAVRDGNLNTDEIPRCVFVTADGTTVVTGQGGPNLPGGYIPGVTAGYARNGTRLWEGFSRMATVWATELPNGDIVTTGGYDAFVTCFRVTGAGGNLPPTAVIVAAPLAGTAPLAVSFDGSGSSDSDGAVTSYFWSFGDGGSSTAASPAHVYSAPGAYAATLTVTDNNGASSSASVSISVSPANDALLRSTAIGLSAALQGKKVNVTGKVTVKDGNGASVSGALVTAAWTLPGGATVTQTSTTGSTGVATFKTTGGRGTYTLTITGIAKSGFSYDAAHSVLSKSITK